MSWIRIAKHIPEIVCSQTFTIKLLKWTWSRQAIIRLVAIREFAYSVTSTRTISILSIRLRIYTHSQTITAIVGWTLNSSLICRSAARTYWLWQRILQMWQEISRSLYLVQTTSVSIPLVSICISSRIISIKAQNTINVCKLNFILSSQKGFEVSLLNRVQHLQNQFRDDLAFMFSINYIFINGRRGDEGDFNPKKWILPILTQVRLL